LITTRTYFLVFILIHFVSLGIAQSNFEIIPLEVSLQDNLEEDDSLNRVGQPQFFAPIAIPFANYSPFISVTIAWQRLAGEATDLPDFSIRYSRDGEEWIEWVPLGWDEHGGDGVERFFTNLYYLESGWKFLQIKAKGEAARSENMTIRPTIHLFNPGESDSGMGQPQNPQSRGNEICDCLLPPMLDRSQWCPDGSCFPHPDPEFTMPTHLIVHHSAGTNVSSDWAAVVRSIWNYHVNSNLWSDIGYNWLIDPNGVIYIGRGDNIVGAHFCAMNGGTQGICVLGDFTNQAPQPPAINSLTDMLAWKSCEEGLDPLATALHVSSNMVYPVISGHRDGCNTQCPGNTFYPMLGPIRVDVNQALNNNPCGCNLPPPEQISSSTNEKGIVLEWVYNGPMGVWFEIERRTLPGGDYMRIDSTMNSGYTDTEVELNVKYSYRVRALVDSCASEFVVFQPQVLQFMPYIKFGPNPVGNELQLEVSAPDNQPVRVWMYSIDGKLVFHQVFDKTDQIWTRPINLTQIAAGVYVIEIRQGEMFKSEQLIRY
jgi:hypothetical protein